MYENEETKNSSSSLRSSSADQNSKAPHPPRYGSVAVAVGVYERASELTRIRSDAPPHEKHHLPSPPIPPYAPPSHPHGEPVPSAHASYRATPFSLLAPITPTNRTKTEAGVYGHANGLFSQCRFFLYMPPYIHNENFGGKKLKLCIPILPLRLHFASRSQQPRTRP